MTMAPAKSGSNPEVERPSRVQETSSASLTADTTSAKMLLRSEGRTRSRGLPPSGKPGTLFDNTAASDDEDFSDNRGSDPSYGKPAPPRKKQATSGCKNKPGAQRAVNSAKPATGRATKGNRGKKQDPPKDKEELDRRKKENPSSIPSFKGRNATASPERQWEKEVRREKQKTLKHKKDLDSARAEIRELKRQVDSYMNDRLGLMSKDKEEVELDPDLENKFRDIFRDVGDLSRAWSVSDWREVDQATVLEVFSSLSSTMTRPFATEKLLLAVQHATIPPRIVLSAFINKEICAETFARPFAHLQLGLHGRDVDLIEVILNEVMNGAEKKSPDSQHKVRVTILRAISDSPAVENHWVKSRTQQAMDFAQKERCKHIASSLIQKMGILFRDVTNEERDGRDHQVLDVVEKAMRLSCVLNMQYPNIQFVFLNDLSKPKFTWNDGRFQLHQALGIDENDEENPNEAQALVGQPLDLVVAPVVERFGNKDGESYDTKNVILQGTVWIVRNSKLTSQEISNSHSANADPDKEVQHYAESRKSVEPCELMPGSTVPHTSQAGQQNLRMREATDLAKKSYGLRTRTEITEKAAEAEAQKACWRNRSKGSQETTRNSEKQKHITKCSATAEQTGAPADHDLICLGERGNVSESAERSQTQLPSTEAKTPHEDAGSVYEDEAQPTCKSQVITDREPDAQVPALEQERSPEQGSRASVVQAATESQPEIADGSPGGTDNSGSHASTALPISTPASTIAQDPATRAQSEKDIPEPHSKRKYVERGPEERKTTATEANVVVSVVVGESGTSNTPDTGGAESKAMKTPVEVNQALPNEKTVQPASREESRPEVEGSQKSGSTRPINKARPPKKTQSGFGSVLMGTLAELDRPPRY
ncbi:hypothetical protein Z517_02711 [Fonsecaea pedrosoi CBS 271.37]|uniref:Uncharacterized protein n=1 Tax=Fonsecaea pedrosoi CBS 271.37 TaxID=1442368 RepID=A0A0D2E0C6_9EURO|nr:uncharacterized protein Z517_02711 [Fonsecaea pedrosoi CBS 271.37]KIW83466.1 hypothetical protein Z517_02711 [Fonsecaea pedrosoi CBS 271.37]